MTLEPITMPESISSPGLGESQKSILEGLLRSGEATLADLEAELDLATETLRDHLKALEAKDLVERAGLRRQGRGRPRVVYRLSRSGQDLFPRREGELLRELASFLQDTGNHQLLERFFETRLQRKRKQLLHQVEGLSGIERMEMVARMLSEEGFMAEIEATSSGRRLRLCHCPLRDVVAVSHLPCRAELNLVGELLGEPLQRQTFMPDGANRCSYSIGEPTAESQEPDAPASRSAQSPEQGRRSFS